MQIRTSLFLILTIVASIDLVKAQTDSGSPPPLPPVYAEYGVQPGLAVEVDSVLTFTQALQLVVTHNPLIGASHAEIRAATGRLLQSRTRLNPLFSMNIEDFGRSTTGGPSQSTFGIEQRVELWGKRKASREAAAADMRATQYDSERFLLELYQQTATVFASLLGAQENFANAEKRLDLALHIQEAVKIKVNDGAAPKAELLRAESSAKLAQVDLEQARASLNRSRIALATLWGGAPLPQRAEGRLDWWTQLPDNDTLLELINKHPLLRGLEAQVESRQANLRLARSLGKPDITVGGGYRRLHDGNDNGFLLWASAPLPIFDRNKGGVQESAAKIDALRAELTFTKQNLTSQLQQLLVTLVAQQTEVALIQNEALPPAKAALEAIDEAYRLGSQPFLNVLDAQRTLAEIQLRLITAQVTGASIVAEIESLTGRPIGMARR